MYPSERTPLASSQPGPPYIFMSNPHREYRKQIRQFQCCVCTTILAIFLTSLIVTIIYSVDNDTEDVPPTPKPVVPSVAPIADNSSLQTLMQLSFPLKDDIPPGWSGPFPDNQQLLSAVKKGKEANAKKIEIEKSMPLMLRDSPTYRYRQAQKTSQQATKLAEYGHVMEEVTKQFSSVSGKSGGRGPKVALSVLDNPACSQENLDTCTLTRYRTIDGSCNNLNRTWGVAMKPFRRSLPPDYADGVSAPKASFDKSPLPSAREVSVMIHRPEYRNDPKFTVMLAVWGQFLDHDLTATALSQGQNGEPITCCSKTPAAAHPECMPVKITPEDPKFKEIDSDCLDFVRSAPAPSCTLGPREQLNQASSFLDGSVVYGNEQELAKKLRSFKGGKMLVSHSKDGKALLPVSTDPNDGCNEEEENKKGRYCFMAGDARSNENLHLTAMHLLFVRQHNMIADQLSALNPDWDDEKIYQEARHIVAAQMQHITYNEFVPVILGPHLVQRLQLKPQTSGYWNKYNKTVDPTIANNFAASSFRFAHTLLPGLMKVAAQKSGSYEAIELHKMLFNPYKLYAAGYMAKAIQGALVTHLERADTYFTPELTQHLFEKEVVNTSGTEAKKPACGLDLVSLNIQRGRDHGLPAYPAWREHCGLKRPKSFEDLRGAMDDESLKKISSVYKSVDDVDLYTGSLSEVPIEGGLLGPTATCLLADQFKRIKDGDRYWYETSAAPQKFSLGQLHEIRKTSLAGIICDTSDGVKKSQRLVMQSVSPSNNRVPCSKIPRTNLDAWKGPYRQKVNVTLVGGDIKTNDEVMVWEGTLPVALPLPAYSDWEINNENVENVLLKVNDGIQWFSSSLRVDKDVIYVNGSFSAPDYENFDAPESDKVNWINGNFNLKFNTNSDFDWELFQSQLISSPVYFEATTDMKVPLPELEVSAKKFILQDSRKKFILQDSPSVSKEKFILQSSPSLSRKKFILQQSPKEVKAPLFLEGTFSEDRTKFYWDGEGFVLLPSSKPTKAKDINPDMMNDQPKKDTDSSEDESGFDRDWVIVPKSNPMKRESLPSKDMDGFQSDMPSDDNGQSDQSNTNADPKDEWENISAVIGKPYKKPSTGVNKGTMQKFQLQSSPKKTNCTKMESIPGHHMNESEADSEWELVPGTISDYRRKGSKDRNHLGPAEPPCNRNVIDDIIDARNEGKTHKDDPITLDASSHMSDNFVKFQLKAMQAKESENSTDGEKKNRVLIKVDPSISLFPSDWKYDNSSGNRIIPVDYFYKVNGSVRTSKPIILWSAKLSANLMTGNISIPEFVLDANHSRHVLWQNTTFSLNFQSSAENVLNVFVTSGATLNSRVVLKDLKISNVENVSNDFETLNWQLDTFQKVSLIQSGNSLPTSDIFLIGEFIENKTAFEWNGSLMVSFENPEKEDNFEVAMKDVTADWAAIPLKVTSVAFNVDSVNGKPAPKRWSSLTPNSFPFAVLADNHITDINSALLWTGHVEGDRLKGNFTLPIFQQSKTSPHVLKGNFELRLRASLPQISWSNVKPAYTKGGYPADSADPADKGLIIVPFLDFWPPPPSYYPKTFPVPFPINITGSAADLAVKTKPILHKLGGTMDNKIDETKSKDSGMSPSLLHWSPGKVLKQVDLSKLIAPTPVVPHLLKNTVPWPPSYPKWPSAKSPPPWEQPYPFADSNAEPHPDEPSLANLMEIEEKRANVLINSKGTQTEWDTNESKLKAKKVDKKPSSKEMKEGMLHAAPASPKRGVDYDIEKLTSLYMKKLATIIKPGVQYATKLLIKSKDGVHYNTTQLNVSQDITNMLKSSVQSKLVIDGEWKENDNYYWPGNAVFLLAPPPSKPQLKKLGSPIGILPYYKGSYAARIVDGSVSAGMQLTGPSTVWSGQMPANIPLPVSWASANVTVEGSSFVKGIHWVPTVVSYDRVEGNYYLDDPDSSNSSSKFSGNFRFELLPIWSDTTVNKLLIPGRKYYSKVVFEPIPDWMKYSTAPQEKEDDPVSVEEEKMAPLTIKGNFNADNSIFEWKGDAVIQIT